MTPRLPRLMQREMQREMQLVMPQMQRLVLWVMLPVILAAAVAPPALAASSDDATVTPARDPSSETASAHPPAADTEPDAEPDAASDTAPPGWPTSPSSWGVPQGGDDSGVFVNAQLFTSGGLTLNDVSAPLPAFQLDRLHLGGGAVYQRWAALVVRLEAIRSASPQSAFGIDKNSLLPRMRLAYGAVSPRFSLPLLPVDDGVELGVDLRAGLIPDLWLSQLEPRLGTRGLLPLPSERAELSRVADLGASAVVDLGDVVAAGVSLTNGEGPNDVERNAGKDLLVTLRVRPVRWRLFDGDGDVDVLAGYRDGSVGVAAVRNHRAFGAIAVHHPLAHVGVEGTWAFGVDGRSQREVALLGAWLDAPLWPDLVLAVGRYDLQAEVGSDVVGEAPLVHRVLGGVAIDGAGLGVGVGAHPVLRRLRLYATAEATLPEAGAVTAVDASQTLAFFLTLEVTAGTDVIDLFRSAPATKEAP